jgi:hypothetical protein
MLAQGNSICITTNGKALHIIKLHDELDEESVKLQTRWFKLRIFDSFRIGVRKMFAESYNKLEVLSSG